MLKIKNRELVAPGQVLAEGSEYLAGEGTFREGKSILSSLLGLAEVKGRFLKVVPLSGRYIPKPEDYVIGVIKETMLSSWIVDINSPYSAILPLSNATSRYIEREEDITRYFDVGDIIFAKVLNVTKSKSVALSMVGRGLRKLRGGRVIEINPTKVPRVIGRSGTMVNMIKEGTSSEIVVGQNGRIWIMGTPENENVAVKAIKKVEKEAHIPGLTNRVKEMLENVPKKGKTR